MPIMIIHMIFWHHVFFLFFSFDILVHISKIPILMRKCAKCAQIAPYPSVRIKWQASKRNQDLIPQKISIFDQHRVSDAYNRCDSFHSLWLQAQHFRITRIWCNFHIYLILKRGSVLRLRWTVCSCRFCRYIYRSLAWCLCRFRTLSWN